MSHLSPCDSCDRHVRCGDDTCPFCGASITARRPVEQPPGRLGRAALFAFGTAVAATVTLSGCNCGTSHTPSDGGSPDDAEVTSDAGTDAGQPDASGFDAGFDAGPIAPPYGTPPEDAGGTGLLYGGAPGD